MKKIRKVVLAYSGGLDTSIILKWLQDEYDCEVVTFTADIGQGEELEPAKQKAKKMGVKEIYVENLQRRFAEEFIFPMFRCNTVYEGEYLLGTSIARPLIVQCLVEIAKEIGADAIAHGATGKGNDQVRFELGAYALMPEVKIIAPWREWDLNSREKLMVYASKHNIPVDYDEGKKSPYSMDANLLHISYEGGILEDTKTQAERYMWRWTCAPEDAPDEPEIIQIDFHKGDPIALNQQLVRGDEFMLKLNSIAGKHGIGRADLVENRYVGIKSRGCYETPAGTILLKAHRAIESITLDKEEAHLKDSIMPRYAETVYNGYWWSPERFAMQSLIDQTQQRVNGSVSLKLYKGNIEIVSRVSSDSLFNASIATFEDDGGDYNQADADGFIKLNSLRLKEYFKRQNN